jgi:hypothetical protein
MNGVRLHLIVTKPQHALLTGLSEKTGLPMSEIFRRALDKYLHDNIKGKDDG